MRHADPNALPGWLLLIVGAVVVALTLRSQPHRLLILDLILVLFPGGWTVAGILVNPTDIVFVGIAVMLLRRRDWKAEVPLLRLWILLGVLQSLAYVHAPHNHQYLTDPLRATYQLYRYCWKPILYYPICVILLADKRRPLAQVILSLLIVADITSVQGIAQGLDGLRASGPFDGTNALGGALVTPLLLASLFLVRGDVGGSRLFYGVSTLLMVRALIFSNSRGAFVATLVGALLCAAGLLTTARGRGMVFRTAGAGVLLVFLLLAVRPDALEGPNVQRLTTVTAGTEVGNFQWRREKRWPFFWKKVKDNPLFGVGTEVDFALGPDMNTPHNGYLALALVHGIPAASLFLIFALLAMKAGVRAFRRSRDAWERAFGLGAGASLLGLLVHNVVDATLLMPFVASLFWMLVAATLTARRREAAPVSEREPVRSSRSVRGAARRRSGADLRLARRTP